MRRLIACVGMAIAALSGAQNTPAQYCGEHLTYATAVTYDGEPGFRILLRSLPAALAVQIGSRDQIGNNKSYSMFAFEVAEYDLPYFREHVTQIAPGVHRIDVWYPYGLQWFLPEGEWYFALTAFDTNDIVFDHSTAFYWLAMPPFPQAGDTWVVGGQGFQVSPGLYPWRRVHGFALAVEFVP